MLSGTIGFQKFDSVCDVSPFARIVVGLCTGVVYDWISNTSMELSMHNPMLWPFRCIAMWFLAISILVLCSCGGASSAGKSFASASPNLSSMARSSSVSISSSTPSVFLKGLVTYDFVPHKSNKLGLNYAATESRPVRGAVIEILNENDMILGASVTAEDGTYSFTVPMNSSIKVRVKAQLIHNTAPKWNFKVTDNVTANALYSMVGTLASTGILDSRRDLHAPSGWAGGGYTSLRVAAPFAILDAIYIGVTGLNLAGNRQDFSPLELRWSKENKQAEGDYTLGEIGTTFFDTNSIYILGDANRDTDEFDRHVILHEWGHYVESNFSRSDSIGGAHADGQKLDMRVAMSEGFANAFSAIMLNDPFYADAFGSAQNTGFFIDISEKVRFAKGYFSEGSVGSIFYNYYASATDKAPSDFTPIFSVLSNGRYSAHPAMTSIFLFYGQLKEQLGNQAVLFKELMTEQNINGVDEYGIDETNDGDNTASVPIYKIVNPDSNPTLVCSLRDFGKFNKLNNSQFLKLTITQSSSYKIDVKKATTDDLVSKPEFIVYDKGENILFVNNSASNSATGSLALPIGVYIIEVYELSNHMATNTELNNFCFNVRVSGAN